jgi:hypothetical protein
MQMSKRFLARIGLADKKCHNCKSFTAKTPEEMFGHAPAFYGAVQVLTPAQVGASSLTDEERAIQTRYLEESEVALRAGKPLPPLPPEIVAAKREAAADVPWNDWKQYGECAATNEGVWRGFHCERWS